MQERDFDTRLRFAAYERLRGKQRETGGPVRRSDVADILVDGQRYALLDRGRGIHKPRGTDAAISFRTTHYVRPDQTPYDDAPAEDGFLRYSWQGGERFNWMNNAMRVAMERDLALIWFQGFAPALYQPVYPVHIVDEDIEAKGFVIAFDEIHRAHWTAGDSEARRTYAQRVVKVRLHQRLFRTRVLTAYERRCTICRLRHTELLDAAHIVSDGDGGEPVVPNGLAMCKIHHAAYDADMIGIDPDYRIHTRADLLDETDGPTLRHALQEVHHTSIIVPAARTARPDRALLEGRFERFSLTA